MESDPKKPGGSAAGTAKGTVETANGSTDANGSKVTVGGGGGLSGQSEHSVDPYKCVVIFKGDGHEPRCTHSLPNQRAAYTPSTSPTTCMHHLARDPPS